MSAILSVVGSIAQGNQANYAAKSQANALEYNAKSDEARARNASFVAGVNEDRQRQQARAIIGEQLATSAGAGAGLNVDLLRQSIFNQESDTADIRYDGQLKSAGLNDQAALTRVNAASVREQGRQAKKAGYLNAATSLMKSAEGAYTGGMK